MLPRVSYPGCQTFLARFPVFVKFLQSLQVLQIGHRKSSLVFPRAFPSSNDVPVLLLNQPIDFRHDLPSDARAFSLTSFKMLSSSLRLNKGLRLFNSSKVPPESE